MAIEGLVDAIGDAADGRDERATPATIPTAAGPARVLIVEPDASRRQLAESLCRADPRLNLLGSTACYDEGERLLRTLQADVALLGVRTRARDRFLHVRSASRKKKTGKASSLTAMVARAECLGHREAMSLSTGCVLGWISTDVSTGELSRALRAAAANACYVSTCVSRATPSPGAAGMEAFAVLTPRERDVLDGVLAGSSSKQVGCSDISISAATVDAYRCRLYRKLGVTNAVELVTLAIRSGYG